MSEFESAGNTRTMIIAVVVIVIIGVAGVSIMLLGSGPGPSGNTTTTTGTTTGTETTTTTTNTGEGVTLTILTRHDISIQGVFQSAFLKSQAAKDANIVELKWRAPTEEFWDDLIKGGTIDVCWGGGPTLFDQLVRDNLLEPMTSAKMQTAADRVNDTIAGVDMKRYSDTDLMWVAAAISTFGFTVNNAFLTDYSLPKPTTWTDLAEPIWAEYLPTIPTISMGNAPDTTSNTRIYEIIVQAFGWQDGWTTMARMAGSSKIMGGSVETQNEVEEGNVGVAMSIDFYGYLSQAQNPDCEYIVPEGQSIVNGDPIAIAKDTPHQAAAEAFVDYVLSPQGQALWLNDDLRRMPVMREAFDLVTGVDDLYEAFNRTVTTSGIDFNDTYSLSMNRAFIKYFESVFTDAHTELVDCWNAIYEAWDEGRITIGELNSYAAQMAQMISITDPKSSTLEEFTPEYAAAINNDMIYDSSYASTVQSRWTAAAKIQYGIIQSLVEAET